MTFCRLAAVARWDVQNATAVLERRQVMSVPFVDAFGSGVKYLRLSVTDRCDLRCRYCMSAAMTFLPSKELLSFDELDRVARCFIASGVDKIRVTGGEPLVRKDIMRLFRGLARYLADEAGQELARTQSA
jgi:GTP 3',8-cyclase